MKPASPSTNPTKINVLKTLWPYLLRWKTRMAIVFVMMVLAKLTNLVVPTILKKIVDNASHVTNWTSEVVLVVLAYGGARLLASLLNEGREMVFAKVIQDTVRRLSLRTFEHLQQLSLRFHLDRQTGRLIRDLERGGKAIETLVAFSLYNIVPTLLEVVLVLGYFWWMYDVSFALITLAALLLYVGFTLYTTEWRTQFRKDMNELDSQANGKAVDSLLNYETVKYFGNEQYESTRYNKALFNWQQASIKSRQSLAMLNFGQSAIIAVALSALMARGVHLMFQGSMTVGDLVLMNILMLQLYIPLNFLGTLYREIKQGILDLEKMQAILNTPREVVDCAGAKPVHFEKSPSIEFKQACFAYDPARPILSNLSFKIEAGTTTAVVGSSGAGKSTLLRLLFRFYDVTGGAVLIDGIDVREMTQESLRKHLGVVPQDTVLFNDTIYYNIAYGNPDASKEAVIDAARRAHIHDLVSRLPLGYDTMVGERGLKLSGGEKQRVAIARTLLKNPSILIFDEATSALDSHSERAIQTELDMLRESKTSLVIAHRLSTVVNADQILVMQAGQVVEAGTHQELLASNGLYASMWQLQQQSEAAEPDDVNEMDIVSLSDR